MRARLVLGAATLSLIASHTSALETGYQSGVHSTAPYAANGAICFDGIGVLYLAHNPDPYPDYLNDQILRQVADGTPALYADGFGSVAALVVQAKAGPDILWVADNYDTGLVGDCVWRLEDLNFDLDCLDPGEAVLYSPHGSIDNIADLARATDGTIYATDADGAGAGDVYILEDLNVDDDCLDPGETRIWATDVESTGTWDFLAGIVVANVIRDHQVIWQDSAGVLRIGGDGNDDGDADDPGEVQVWVTGLTGGIDLVRGPEGDLFCSGSGLVHRIERVAPDGSFTTFEEFDPGLVGWTGPLAFESPGDSFEPSQGTNVLHMTYSDSFYASALETLTFTPEPMTPTMGPLGGLLLTLGLGALMARRRRRR